MIQDKCINTRLLPSSQNSKHYSAPYIVKMKNLEKT